MSPCKHCGAPCGSVRCPDALAQIDAGTYTGEECCVAHYGCTANGGRGCAYVQGARLGNMFRVREESARWAALTPKQRQAENERRRIEAEKQPTFRKLKEPYFIGTTIKGFESE